MTIQLVVQMAITGVTLALIYGLTSLLGNAAFVAYARR